MVTFEKYVNINGKNFIDVTNQTVVGPTYNYDEAVAWTQGRPRIVTSYSIIEIEKPNKKLDK